MLVLKLGREAQKILPTISMLNFCAQFTHLLLLPHIVLCLHHFKRHYIAYTTFQKTYSIFSLQPSLLLTP